MHYTPDSFINKKDRILHDFNDPQQLHKQNQNI